MARIKYLGSKTNAFILAIFIDSFQQIGYLFEIIYGFIYLWL